MANFFSGYLAQGTGTGNSFVENATSGYARQGVTLATLSFGQTGLNAGVTFPGLAAAYTVTQRALYDTATGGNLIMWWALRNPLPIMAGGTDTLASGAFSLSFPDLVSFSGSTALQWTAGTVIGSTSMSTPITAGVTIAYTAGTLEASSAAGLSGGSGVGFPGGAGLSSATGSLVTVGSGLVLTNGTLTGSGASSLAVPNSNIIGGNGSTLTSVSIGAGLSFLAGTLTNSGVLTVPTANLLGGTGTGLSGVSVGSGLSLASGTLSSSGTLTVPTASLLGGSGSALTAVNLGSGLILNGGTLATSGGGAPSSSTSFTPAVYIAGSTSGATYTTQSGRYWQNGALTVFNVDVEWSTMGSTNGAITITGLPAAVLGGCGQLLVAGYGVTASGPVYGIVNTSGVLTLLIGGSGTGSNDPALTTSNLAPVGGIIVAGSYFTA